MHEMFTRDGRELSLDTVIYDRSKKKGVVSEKLV